MTLTTNQKLAIALTAVVAVAAVTVAIFYVVRIRTQGRILTIGIEVYKSADLGPKLEFIDWADISPSESKYVECWVLNTQNTAVTLELLTENYNPAESQQYLKTAWDISPETVLGPQEAIKANIVLTVSPNAQNVTGFSYDIVIKATKTG